MARARLNIFDTVVTILNSVEDVHDEEGTSADLVT